MMLAVICMLFMYQVVMKGVKHPNSPPHKAYSRSNIIFSLNLLTEIKPPSMSTNVERNSEDCSHLIRTQLTTISHVSYTGVFPFLVNRQAFQGIVDFMTSLDSFASSTS